VFRVAKQVGSVRILLIPPGLFDDRKKPRLILKRLQLAVFKHVFCVATPEVDGSLEPIEGFVRIVLDRCYSGKVDGGLSDLMIVVAKCTQSGVVGCSVELTGLLESTLPDQDVREIVDRVQR